jgi:hypothetical protein
MTPDELINTIRTAGLIKVHTGAEWIDLRPVLVEFIESAVRVRSELERSVSEVAELEKRIQNLANGTW